MNKARIQIAKPNIFRFFDNLSSKVYRQSDIARFLSENRNSWHLAQSTTLRDFIRFLTEGGKISKIDFPFPKPYKREVRYIWGKVSLYQVVLTLKPGGYFSHYTAVKFHGLTEQLPKTIYLNVEQQNPSVSFGKMDQESIDRAFRGRQRTSANIAETKDFRVCIISGKNTGRLGVTEEEISRDDGRLRFTNLERTLIDIAVRPVYAGGVFEVRKAYELAKDKVSVNRLAALLQKLEFTYPYHQAIGFYLERAGYKPAQLDLLRHLPRDFDFYLTHQMAKTDYVKEWRLHVPKGF